MRGGLEAAITSLRRDGIPYAGRLLQISPETEKAALRLCDLVDLAGAGALLHPDDEGGLELHFSVGGIRAIVVVDGWTLHAVARPASDRTTYIEDVPFDGASIPARLAILLPLALQPSGQS